MGYEAVHHKRLFDAVCPGADNAHLLDPGVTSIMSAESVMFREPQTLYVAQANNPACQADDARIQRFRISDGEDLVRRQRRQSNGDRQGQPGCADATGRPDTRRGLRSASTTSRLAVSKSN